jgi:F-type H+-transporting ATPase subunit b
MRHSLLPNQLFLSPLPPTVLPEMLEFSPLFLAAAAEHAADPGLAIKGGKILAQLIVFGIVAFILNRFAFQPLLATMDQRQAKIADGLKFADEMKVRSTEAEAAAQAKIQAASDEAARILAEARASAKALSEREQQQAISKAEGILAKADTAIAQQRKQMLADVRKEVAGLVTQVAGVVLSKELTVEEKARFNQSASAELASRN